MVSGNYDQDFPCLGRMEDTTPKSTKNDWNLMWKEIERSKYLKREKQRQEMMEKKRAKTEAEAKAKAIRLDRHIEMMKQRWGSEWFHRVEGTDDDCPKASELRWIQEQKWHEEDLAMEKREKEKDDMIAQKTKGMTEDEKRSYLMQLARDEFDKMDDGIFWSMENYFDKQRNNRLRLEAFNEKHGLVGVEPMTKNEYWF